MQSRSNKFRAFTLLGLTHRLSQASPGICLHASLRTPGSSLTSRDFHPLFIFFIPGTLFFPENASLGSTFVQPPLLEHEGLSFPNLSSLCAEGQRVIKPIGAAVCLFITRQSHCYLVQMLSKFATCPSRLQPARSRLMRDSQTVLGIFTASYISSYLLHSAFKPFLTHNYSTLLHKQEW